MLELAILGFLAEGPLHGYALRQKIARLSGYVRPVSDGSLYPAISRLIGRAMIDRREEPGVPATRRQVLHLTDGGHHELCNRLREADGYEVSDFTRFGVVLAFLSHLPDPDERHAVLRRRLAFLERPASFFHDKDDRPLRQRDVADPYRQGLFVFARAASTAERAWLRQVLAGSID